MFISKKYKKQIELKHKKDPNWGDSALHYWDLIKGDIEGKTVVDYGCGKGVLKEKLPHIVEYDPAIKGKEKRVFPADTVLCIDVLEHIEPEYLDAVLQDIKDLTLKKAVFVISTRKAKNCLPDGRNAHLIIEDVNWWVKKLMEYFNIEYKEYHEWVYIKAWQQT